MVKDAAYMSGFEDGKAPVDTFRCEAFGDEDSAAGRSYIEGWMDGAAAGVIQTALNQILHHVALLTAAVERDPDAAFREAQDLRRRGSNGTKEILEKVPPEHQARARAALERGPQQLAEDLATYMEATARVALEDLERSGQSGLQLN